MNKKDLINEICCETELTKKEIDLVLTLILEKIMRKVSEGEKVRLVGFGSFFRVRKKMSTRDVQDKSVDEFFSVKFSPGKFFKQRTNVQN